MQGENGCNIILLCISVIKLFERNALILLFFLQLYKCEIFLQ